MLMLIGLVRKSTLLDVAARCTCTSRTPRPALTAPRHDVTAGALSGLAAHRSMSKVLVQLRRNPSACSTTRRCTSRAPLRAAIATRLDVYSTTHRCVEWPCFTEAKSVPPSRDYILKIGRGRERGRERTFRSKCRSPSRPATALTSRAARATAHEAVETASWAPFALTVFGGQTVVMLEER